MYMLLGAMGHYHDGRSLMVTAELFSSAWPVENDVSKPENEKKLKESDRSETPVAILRQTCKREKH